jgi:HD-like signal output (HDOD) protein
VHKAVVRLGTEMVTDFVLFSETYSFASGCTLIDMEKLVKASFAISRLGAAMAREILPDKVAEVKLAGLLCEIGQSVLIQAFPDKAQDYLDRIAYADEAETLAIEMELFTASDEQVGAFLLMFWGFSTDIIDGVLYSRLPEKALSPGHNVAALVYVARLIYKGISIDEQTISRLGIEEHLPKWNEMATRLKGA